MYHALDRLLTLPFDDVDGSVFLALIGLVLGLNGIWHIVTSFFPKFVRIGQSISARPLKPFLVGIGVGLLPICIATALLGIEFGGIAGWPLLLVVAALSLAGTAILAQRIGTGLPSQNDRLEPWRRSFRGGIALSLSFLLPIVGWIWLICALTFGAGVALLTIVESTRLQREAKLEAEREEAEERAALEDESAVPETVA